MKNSFNKSGKYLQESSNWIPLENEKIKEKTYLKESQLYEKRLVKIYSKKWMAMARSPRLSK